MGWKADEIYDGTNGVSSSKSCPICDGNGTVGSLVRINPGDPLTDEAFPCPFCEVRNRITELEKRLWGLEQVESLDLEG